MDEAAFEALGARVEALELAIALVIEALGPKPRARLEARLKRIREGADPRMEGEDPQVLALAARRLEAGLDADEWGL
jgi:hypothetical protein